MRVSNKGFKIPRAVLDGMISGPLRPVQETGVACPTLLR